MGSSRVQMLCFALGVMGLIGVMVCLTVPQWRVAHYYKRDTIGIKEQEKQTVLEGLWFYCVVQSDGLQQCGNVTLDRYSSRALKPMQAMTITSCLLCCFSLVVLCGVNFTSYLENEDTKSSINLVAGWSLLLSGSIIIITVSWAAFRLPWYFYYQYRSWYWELGFCMYVGWGAGVLLLVAGGLMCHFMEWGSSGVNDRYYTTVVFCNVPDPVDKIK